MPCTVSAQELVPRGYWPTPNGTNVLVLSYQRSTGDIVTDPTLPLAGVESTIDYLQLSYQRTFSLAGRTTTMQLSLPYADGETSGLLHGELRSRELTGLFGREFLCGRPDTRWRARAGESAAQLKNRRDGGLSPKGPARDSEQLQWRNRC